ncbi:HNH endonuclease [Paenibacillus sp. 276b]|uniref:HNH endonuclease n=1 Tax=Paenibacillus sp. 276b TaxID=1566277 RepID=UPI00089AFF8B|nr:HNH endonuclease [Paenibacillus sp. 276b]SEB27550.1 hypothetical protein SAMN03159332_6214 [Paenibacillus sp. 276b]
MLDASSFYNNNYRIHSFKLDGKMYLGSKENKVCRFCGLTYPEVKFKDKAHAVPELLGNKNLFSYYECSTCNKDIFAKLENELGNYNSAYRTLTYVKGKRGVPTYKDNKITIRAEGQTLKIEADLDSDQIVMNEEEKTLTVTVDRYSYLPIAVYKAYIKMALTLMNENEIQYFSKTIDWIMNVDHSADPWCTNLIAIVKTLPGMHVFPHPVVRILYRYDSSPEQLPYAILVICSGNQIVQVLIPHSDKDEGFCRHLSEGRGVEIPPHPVFLTKGNREGSASHQFVDWSSCERVPNEKQQVVYSYRGFDDFSE